MKTEKPSSDILNQWHNDPDNWKWGFIYFNPKDKRVLVPKRQKFLGLTVNFASPYSLLVLIGIVALIAFAEWLKSV